MVDRRQFVKIGGAYGLSIIVLGLGACGRTSLEENESLRHLILLYTNDEHGWMDAYQETGGAADLMYKWRTREDYEESDDRFLILSGGDMWTGPALSTATYGESMIDVMNAMGYRAAAIGNHDFDFGLENLQARSDQANFPFIAGNIKYKDDESMPDFLKPYTVLDVNGVKAGILGLTTNETKIDTKPESVVNLDFTDYKKAIEIYIPQMRADGAELILIISHLCKRDTGALAPFAAEQGVAFVGGGHCHQVVSEIADGTRVVESGYFMRGYSRVDLFFDKSQGEVVSAEVEYVPNREGRADPEIADIIEGWREKINPSWWDVIGYTEEEIDRRTSMMDEIVTGSWLLAWPVADVALASRRYMQQDIDAGDITKASILSVLATDNRLLEVVLTGEQLLATINSRRPMMAGVSEEDGDYVLSDGSPVQSGETYRVLIPHSLYSGGNYYDFYLFDEHPVETGLDWRTPVIDWIQSMDTSKRNPLDELLEPS